MVAWTFVGVSALGAEPPPALVVNGGGTATSNSSDFDREARAFYALLGGRLLNAGGQGTPMIERTKFGFVRDEAGRLALTPSAKDLPAKAAEFIDVAEALREIAQRNPSVINLYFIGHGTPGGLVLWKRGVLTPEFFRSWLDKLPATTVVLNLSAAALKRSM